MILDMENKPLCPVHGDGCLSQGEQEEALWKVVDNILDSDPFAGITRGEADLSHIRLLTGLLGASEMIATYFNMMVEQMMLRDMVAGRLKGPLASTNFNPGTVH
jgi:hypothetical protein